MDWWDDLWLNESFAQWMGDKISDEVNPQYNQKVVDLRETNGAMFTDSRLSTRAIRRPVTALDNLLEAADQLAYQKGQSVLGMFEEWMGPETFQKGVRAYLNRHAWGNTQASDLWDALSQASGKDAKAAMSTFLDQEGIPLVTADLLADGKVKLTQKRFLSYGVQAPKEQLWQIPVALSYSDGAAVKTQHVLLTEREMTVTLEGARAPDWIHPNAGASGYYRWSMSSDMMSRLAGASGQAMSPVERVGYLGNLSALLEGGLVHGDEFTRLIGKFADDPTPEVILGLMDDVAKVRQAFVTRELADPYAAYVRKTLGPAMRRFGLARQPGEGESVSLVRPGLIHFLADDGRDPRVLAFADSLARQHLASPGSVDPSLIATALEMSATNGDEALFQEYKKRFEGAEIPAERARYLEALGFFRDPKIADEAIQYSLRGPLRPQEVFTIPRSQAQAFEYEDVPYKWMSENFGTIASKIPPMFMVFMPLTASGCSMERLEKAKVFFADPQHQVPGTDKELAKVADQVTDCANLRQREGALVATYLTTQVGAR
jgi:alanyl aminopeptidase